MEHPLLFHVDGACSAHLLLDCCPTAVRLLFDCCSTAVRAPLLLLLWVVVAEALLRNSTDVPPELSVYIDMLFPGVASALVVAVNVGVGLLVSALGKFERHTTLSGMHRNKALTIFAAQVRAAKRAVWAAQAAHQWR